MVNDPIYLEAYEHCRQLLDRAKQTDLREPWAVSLATVGADGRPSVRVVLLRNLDERGLVFYTNLKSRKAQQLAENPRASLCFYWDELREQLRIDGPVALIAEAESDQYWRGRPRDSQIGAWASRQSAALEDRATLEQRVADYEARFAEQDVPRPDFWQGFRLTPQRIEFWTARPARLHDRLIYQQEPGGWTSFRVYP